MKIRLTVTEVAEATRRHPVTIRRALEAGHLHGAQRSVHGTWMILEECAEAWADHVPCEHQAAKKNVTPIRRKRA